MKRSILSLSLLSILFGGCAQQGDNNYLILASDTGREDITFNVVDNIAHMYGVMDSSTLDRMQQLLMDNPGIDTISLDSVLGTLDFHNTLETGYYLREKGINTHIPGHGKATSGAVYLFMSGIERTIELGGQVGIHQWKYAEYNAMGDIIGGSVASEYQEDHEEHTPYLEYQATMGIDSYVYWEIVNTPFDNMRFLSLYELNNYGIVTDIIME